MISNITYDGNFVRPVAIKAARTTYPIQNFNSLKLYFQDFVQLASEYTVPQIGITHPVHANAILVEESNFSNLAGGLFSFTRTFCEFPTTQYEQPVLISYAFPGFKSLEPQYTTEIDEDGNTTSTLTDFKERIWRNPITKQVTGRQVVQWHNLLDNTNAKTITLQKGEITLSTAILYKEQIYYPTEILENSDFKIFFNDVEITLKFTRQGKGQDDWQAVAALANGYNFDNLEITDQFKIFDKKRTVEQSTSTVEGQEVINTYTKIGSSEETNFLSTTSSPSEATYQNYITDGVEIQPNETVVEQFIGSIYTTKNTLIKFR
tara:strand:+ start:13510 stop:14469 length:960 start_codon:yes stop_codon:yes gene_type:complete